MKKNFGILILAAGQGTRMKSALPKVLHHVGGLPMLAHVLKAADSLGPGQIGVVVGHGAHAVERTVSASLEGWSIKSPVRFIEQKILKGSGRAVQEALPFVKKFRRLMIICGDAPLMTGRTLFSLLKLNGSGKSEGVVLTARVAEPGSYGRVVRSESGREVAALVEACELGPGAVSNNEINSGAYVFETKHLVPALRRLKRKGPKKEFFLTDVIENISSGGGKILPLVTVRADEIMGVNSRLQLAEANRIFNARVINELMCSGVTIMDPSSTWIDSGVRIGTDTVILPGTHISGKTVIGSGCEIGPCVQIEGCALADNVQIKFGCSLSGSKLLEGATVGPFSHVRPGCRIGPCAKIGNFSEIKASSIGKGSKVPHLSYVGDTDMGEKVNIGAGTITCNYDGNAKHRTVIGSGAFIGSNVNLVAPVKVGSWSKIGAGSTITENVPDSTLALARARQIIKTLKR
ncbi:MAG: bifunctional UDP-N-acetylglucosamine diphosphorylase/glucosamine-1-phosphate N-acetyltransferase GlmU [bacterium]